MKYFIVLAVFVSCASASQLYGAAPVATPVYGEQGSSTQFRAEDNYGNYKFGYDESHTSGASGRHEERNGHTVRGSYRLGDADGRQRTVDYHADATGFHANVHTNEPGVDASREPANVRLSGNAVAVAAPLPVTPYSAPAPVYSAPVASYSAPAPVYPTPAASYSAPAPVYPTPAAPAYRAPTPAYTAPTTYTDAPAPVYEAPRTPFAYSFGTAHQSATYAAPVVAPVSQEYAKPY